MNHYDILIATPGTSIDAQYVDSLSETLSECQRRGLTYKWLNGQASLVYHARESAISGGPEVSASDRAPLRGEVTYNKIIWIDSDIVWTVDNFFRLYDSDYDVVCGAYLLGDGVTTSVHAWGKIGGIPKYEILRMRHPLKIQSMGLGFAAMKTGVFERLPRPWFTHFTQSGQTPSGDKIDLLLGEDITWCVKAYQAGIDIYFDPKVLVSHMKTKKISWK